MNFVGNTNKRDSIQGSFLRSFHGSMLCFDKNNKRIIHSNSTSDSILPITVQKEGILLSLFYKDDDIYYLNSIDGLKCEFSKFESLFGFTKNSDGTISIIVNGKYLSARRGSQGNVSLIEHNKDWEHFLVDNHFYEEENNHSSNSICFFTAVNDAYAPVLACLILSMKDNSRDVFDNADFIIYHEGVSKKNMEAIKKSGGNISFVDINYDGWPDELYSHKLVKQRWGKFLYQKLRGFELINNYKKVVWIDADMLNLENIYPLLSYTYMAGRSIMSNEPLPMYSKNLVHLTTPIPNGGLVLFSEEVKNYSINNEKLLQAYRYVKEMKNLSGIDELLMSAVAHINGIKLHNLPIEYNLPDARQCKKYQLNVKLIHYMNSKPWEDYYSIIQNPSWEHYYIRFVKDGGRDIVDEKHMPLFDQHFRGIFYWRIVSLLSMVKNIRYFNDGTIISNLNLVSGDLEFFFTHNNSIKFSVAVNKQYYCSPASNKYMYITCEDLSKQNEFFEQLKKYDYFDVKSKDSVISIIFKKLDDFPKIIEQMNSIV